jgi:hypothetical protein
VELEIPDGVTFGTADLSHRWFGPGVLFADPEKIMWWCELFLTGDVVASEVTYSKLNEDCAKEEHEGCGWVARPTVTWKEATNA